MVTLAILELDHDGRTWRQVLDLHVDGDPATQGSHRIKWIHGKPVVVADQTDNLVAWRTLVEVRAKAAIGHRWRANPITGEVRVVCDFVLQRPPPDPRRKNDPLTYKHDGDKLTRSCHDSLSDAGVFADDGAVTSWGGSKRLTADGEKPGVRIRVYVPAAATPLPSLTVDKQANAAYVELRPRTGLVAKTLDLGHGVAVDLDVDGEPLGYEILNLHTRECDA